MIKQFNLALVTMSAVVLAACSGGSSAPASTTSISQSQATNALGLAKNSNLIFGGSIADLSAKGELLKLLTPLGGQTGGSLSASSTSNCGVSGQVSVSYSKASAAAGLTQGDRLNVSYNNCVTSAGQPTLTGNVVVTAGSTTTTDISNATNYSIPFSLLVNNYQVVSSSVDSTYNGNINYSVFTIGTSGVSATRATATTNDLASVNISGSNTLYFNYQNARFATVIPASGSISVDSKFDLTTTTNTVLTPLTLTVESNLIGQLSAPTSAMHTVTNYLGGKITGWKSSGSSTMNVSVDEGNNGIIELNYTTTY